MWVKFSHECTNIFELFVLKLFYSYPTNHYSDSAGNQLRPHIVWFGEAVAYLKQKLSNLAEKN